MKVKVFDAKAKLPEIYLRLRQDHEGVTVKVNGGKAIATFRNDGILVLYPNTDENFARDDDGYIIVSREV